MCLTMGEKIKDERVKRKWTSKNVCDELLNRYNYKLSIGKYNEIESDVDKDFGYKVFVYLSKLFDVSTDYLFGISECSSVDEDIKIVHKVTGLSEESIKNISSLKNKSALELFISTPLFITLINHIDDILEHCIDKRHIDFLFNDTNILNKIENQGLNIEFIERHILMFLNERLDSFQFSLPDSSNIFDDMIYLDRFKASETFSEIIKSILTNKLYDISAFNERNQILLEYINSELVDKRKIIDDHKNNELNSEQAIDFIHHQELYYQHKYTTFCRFKELLEMEMNNYGKHNSQEE